MAVLALEVLAEARDVIVADALGDAGDGQPGGREQFGSLFEAEFLQIGLETESVMLAKETAQVAGAGEGDLAGHFGEFQRTVQPEGQVRGRTLQRIAMRLGSGTRFFRHTKPHGLHMTARRVLRGGRITQRDGFDEMLMLVRQHAGIGKVVLKALAVKVQQFIPGEPPRRLELRHLCHLEDRLVQLEIGFAKSGVVASTQRLGQAVEDGAQLFEGVRRASGMAGRMPRGKTLQQRAELGKAAQFGGVHRRE